MRDVRLGALCELQVGPASPSGHCLDTLLRRRSPGNPGPASFSLLHQCSVPGRTEWVS